MKCLYKKSYIRVSKSHQILLKSIAYFSVETFKIISKNPQIENLIQTEFGLKARQEGTFDMIYHDFPSIAVLSIDQNDLHNDSIILIDNIHENKAANNNWKALKQSALITVSIDMFYCGLLCLRKEQVKEHFKIRI